MLSRGVVDFKHFENVKSLFENVSLYIGLIAYTAAGAKVRQAAGRLEILNSCNVAPKSVFNYVPWFEFTGFVGATYTFRSSHGMQCREGMEGMLVFRLYCILPCLPLSLFTTHSPCIVQRIPFSLPLSQYGNCKIPQPIRRTIARGISD